MLKTLSGILSVSLGLIVAIALLTVLFLTTPLPVGAVLTGVFLFLFVLPVFPWAIHALTNNPNRDASDKSPKEGATAPAHKKSEFGFFTYLQPGRVKGIERGQRFVRFIMKYPGKRFAGEAPNSILTYRQIEYWEVEDSGDGPDSDPLPFPLKKWSGWRWARWWFYSPLSVIWWVWKEWVYVLTGAVFTGIYPFQKVRVYPIERFKKVAQAQSEAVKEGSIRLDRIVDWSDHYRVADFQYPIRIPEADTKDKVPVRILVNLVARVFNPYLTAYNTDDDWATRLLAAISGAVIPYVRSHSIDKVLSAESEAGARELEGIIFAIGDRNGNKDTQGHAVDFGVTVRRVQTLDISPTKDTDRTKLGELAFARVDRTSAEERAFGKAADILRAGEALRLYPEAAAIPQIEGNVRAAAAAPNAILNIGGQQQIDPVLVQILNTLRSQPRPIESERQSEDTNEENTNG